MKYKLDNKKVLITGASGGIGKSLCEKFIGSNCNIVCTSSSIEKLDNLKYLYGNNHNYYLLNFSDTNSLFDSIKQIAQEHKDIDTTDFKKVLSRMGGDSWFFSELSPTYIRISNSPLWEKLPDTLSEKVNEIYYSQFTMIKKAFEKSVEYGTHYKLNYLVPNSLIDTEISSIEIKKIIMGNEQ